MPGEKYYITIALNLVTDSGGSYINFVSANDLQVQPISSDLTEVKDDEDIDFGTESTDNTEEGE